MRRALLLHRDFLVEREFSHFVVEERARKEAADPAALFYVPSKDVVFGMIASDTEPFCSDCTRARITADGNLYTCLFTNKGHDLKSVLRIFDKYRFIVK